ncbi:MAG: 3-dehydroquinate synthase [Cycloclasticus sp. symbiont of Poecilosclerida sp. M]|nr:MAG: 3-dehydroquinate synthase [Cycloclasticus sp. symbiont of Poecilosclerida sp. M]
MSDRQKVTVELGDRSYPIFIGHGLLNNLREINQYIAGKQILIITNDTVEPLYLETVKAALNNKFTVITHIIQDGERFKTLASIEQIYSALLENVCNRQVTLIALGGGVIGDMTGFAAATYQRGVNFIQIPTTLLAQVDSSVGGKTGVNHPLGKNMIGAFYQPRCVISDTSVLATLPDNELSAGLAEVIKCGVICDAEFFTWLERNIEALVSRAPEALAKAIRVSCEKKAQIVKMDEREHGLRATLNFGHTFGHAIEAGMGYGTWLHGEAVSVGMCMAANLSNKLGWLSVDDVSRIKSLCIKAGLPVDRPKDLSADDFLQYMQRDKKNTAAGIRLILLKSVGEAVVYDGIDTSLMQAVIEEG